MTAQRPEYVVEFAKSKPPHTEIKAIKNRYYLYESYSKYDPVKKRSTKISGKMLGTITPDGLEPCRRRKPRIKNNPTAFDKYMEKVSTQGANIVPEITTDKETEEVDLSVSGDASHTEGTIFPAESANAVANRDDQENAAVAFRGESDQVPGQESVHGGQCDGDEVSWSETRQVSGEQSTPGKEFDKIHDVEEGTITGNDLKQSSQENADLPLPDETREGFQTAPNVLVPALKACSNVEIGASLYLYSISKEIRYRLRRNFSENHFWILIYTIAMIRTIYGPRFRRLRVHYVQSILSHIYPDLPFDKESITLSLQSIGCRRPEISSYMKESLSPDGVFLLLDGHRLLSLAKDMPSAEWGYDSKQRHSRQVNLLYVYELDENGKGLPKYYKQYNGSTPDVQAISDLRKELGDFKGDLTVVADKGCVSEENIEGFASAGLKYVVPLERGNRFVKGRVPTPSPKEWDVSFYFNDRAVLAITFHEEDRNVHLFFDCSLYSEEMRTKVGRAEKEKGEKSTGLQKEIEKKRSKLVKEEAAAERAATAKEKAQRKLDTAIQECKKYKDRAERAQKALAEAVMKLTSLDKGSEKYDKVKAKIEKLYADVANASKEEQQYNILLEATKRSLGEKTEQESAAIQKATNTKEILDLLVAFSEGRNTTSVDEILSLQAGISKFMPQTMDDLDASTREIGTITIITNRMEDSAERIYTYYKQRVDVEKFFDMYDNTMDFEACYMEDKVSFEGWCFLNHISAELTASVLNEISRANKTKDWSFKDAMAAMRNISADHFTDGSWSINPIKEATESFCSCLQYSPQKALDFFDWEYAAKLAQSNRE